MHLITYTSRACVPDVKVPHMVTNIVDTAKRENPKHWITGVLFFHANTFLQIIEGDEPELRQLMRNIKADKRHTDIEYLIDLPIEERGFPDWNMDFFNLAQDSRFDADSLRVLTENYRRNILPHGQALVFFYKKLLETQEKMAS